MIEAYYYLFSLTTFFIAIVHVMNMASIKRRGRAIIKTYWSETSKSKSANVMHGKYYSMLYIGALFLLLTNLIYAMYVMLQGSDRQRAINALAIISCVVVIVFIAIIMGTRNYFKESKNKHP